MTGQRGFTLLEMMIALTIFGVLSMAGITLLQGSLRNGEQVRITATTMAALQKTLWIMEQDLSQVIVRTRAVSATEKVRGDFIIERDKEQDRTNIIFLKGNRLNQGELLPRSTLEWVQWHLRDGQLVRRTWTLDQPTGQKGSVKEVVVMNDVTGFDITILPRKNGEPPRREELTVVPRAIEVRLDTSRLGSLTRTLLISDIL